ncbi:MAG: DNA topoisomerase IV subunit B, partial [Mycoplasmataceae bacterium]|nr:DNA topoisomerase IV subunit B [Mycoplasmataceae bacterium]
AEKIIEKALVSRDARLAAKRAREDVKKLKNANKQSLLLSGKLVQAQSKNYKENELFLVEGDSAGGTAKLSRDKKNQAILPLKGKVINVEKAKLRDLLSNEEICTIISCIGAGIAQDFNVNDSNYGKIIIMTDADVDGSHIQILLLTFFYRFMKPLIEKNMIFIAMPPLYKLTNKKTKESKYIWDEKEMQKYHDSINNFDVQRYKGLGEMNADQLWETTMNIETRQLVKVTIEDAALAERRITTLMGDNTVIRKEWIDNNVVFEFDGD